MLSWEHRLRWHREFTAALRSGRGVGRGSLVVHLSAPPAAGATGPPVTGRSGGPAPRAGFVVPRAVGGAVVRNRVRRRLRHLTREHLAGLPPGSRLVVRALPQAANSTYRRLGEDLAAALRVATHRATAGGGPARIPAAVRASAREPVA
jgi:ribonuclease P protein component